MNSENSNTNRDGNNDQATSPKTDCSSTSHHHHRPHQQSPSRRSTSTQQRRLHPIILHHQVASTSSTHLRRKQPPQLHPAPLPMFISSAPELIASTAQQRLSNTPTHAPPCTEFATPMRKASRPNSPITTTTILQKPTPFRGRIASIRRESDCSLDAEAAHERLVKCSQQVSLGFEDFGLDEKLFDDRKRAKSLTEPISIFTNAFLPQSSSPSPTRAVDIIQQQKQCYSPSTQQVVRSNIPYSPSPSPTPSSPTHNRIMRSMSPIAIRQISKRRYTGSGNNSGLESSDGEGSLSGYPLPAKRHCPSNRSAASPLVRDPLAGSGGGGGNIQLSSSSLVNNSGGGGGINSAACTGLDEPLDNSSTTFSSRAGTPLTQLMEEEEEMLMEEERINETDLSSSSLLPNASLSSAGSSSSLSAAGPPPPH